MKHFSRILSVAIVMTSIGAFADPVNNFTNLNVSFGISPNNGSGDNVGGSISGPGIDVSFGGGTPYYWFGTNIPGYPAGSTGGGSTTIFFDLASGTINSQSYGSSELSLGSVTFDAGVFSFPTNGQEFFTVTVRASVEGISGSINDCSTTNCPSTFTLFSRPGTLTLSYDYLPFWNTYEPDGGYFSSYTTTPESGTFWLMAIGMSAVAGYWLKRQDRFVRKTR